MRFSKHIVGCLFAILFGTLPLISQTVTGSIVGSVTDASGAVLPGAQVVAHNLDTGVDSPTTTNASGFYRIEFLPIGHYQVIVSANGFNTQTLPPFSLEVLQTPTFNVKLEVGSSSTTVSVSAAAPILNTNDPTLGTTFTSNTIQNFPLNGLDFSALTLYVPGSVSTAGTSGTTSIERSTYYTDSPNLNGNRAQANNYTLDGIDMNETQNNLISYSPAPDALAEVRVLTANSPADYGNVNGGGVVSVLKSGSNQFHGSAYGYTQNANFNANTWFNNHQNPKLPINPFSQSQFGGTFGGPIKRDKLFFFVDYLGARFHQGGTTTASVLTAAMRNGDYSVLLSGANGNQAIQLYDSQNNFAPYVNNQIPVVNPVAKFLFANPSLYPLPNATPSDGIAANNLQGSSRKFSTNNQGDVKIEYDPRASDKITGFYSMSTAYDGSTALLAIAFPSTNLYPTKLGGLNWVHIFSPGLINSARIGFTRTTWNKAVPTDPSGLFGLAGNSKVGIPFGVQSYVGFSNQGLGGGLSDVGTTADNQSIIDNTFSYIDNLTWQRGLHLLSMGVQALRYQNDYTTDNNQGFLGTFNYNGDYTSNPALTNAGGYGPADFVLDRVSEAAITSQGILVGQRQWRVAGFVQDDWKILPNLTLNIGLRYEYDQPWIEANNKTGNILLGTGQVVYAGHVPAGAPPGSGVCSNRACYQPTYNQFMPRLGFAYQANDRFVLRGGYGATSFFEGNAANQRLTSITPFVQAVDIKPLTPTTTSPGAPRTVEQGFSFSDPADINFNGSSYNVYPQNIKPAYVQEWSLTAEYAITRTTSLQVGYLGEQGQHIEDYGNVNQYLVNGDPTTAPFFNNTNLGIGSQTLLITESRAAMNFNALESTLRQRLNNGLEFTLNYTYGKALTNSLGNYSLNVNGYSGAFQNYYDSHADWGPAGYDVRHNVSGTGVYALPVGRGKTYLSGVNRWVDEAIGGWKIAVAGVAYSGFPQTVTAPGNNSNSYGSSRANQYRKLKIVNRTVNNWFGTDPSATPCTAAGVDNGVCAFGVPAPNTFGSSSNGAVRGPGYLNVDSSAFKDFHIVGEQSLGFRFDAFNVFNIASYGNPDIGVTDTNFGQIASLGTPVRSVERHLQFSARYSF
ncbi:TonB-dependent receptor [Acidisarcina polymorpha]|uniref:TonB-dependent receptor n=1 Tax=Acidisarcina polymorpha TaxID=2211140 RepID=UPI000DEEE34F|nr:TonB-dependent receptor [Acidisarcina polymorpha]